ncbi:MAG TPA: hypothetical protein VFR49_09060, partial [Solirubrobacteraceae bacterium]|nr:hypothetical protein [Solirubrobacteraceae bacterium]
MAAGLAGRLAVPVGYVRGLLFAGSLVQPAVIYAYLLAALALPHEGRRPDWVNLIGFARVATAFGLVWSVGAGGVGIAMFDQGPGVWVTQGGVCLAGLLALLATGAPAAERDRARDRRSVLAALPLVGGAGLVALGVVLVPGVRWERVLAGVALAGGLAAMVGVGRGGSRGLIAPAGTIALATVVLALAGTRLDGGVGNRRV